MYPEKSVLFSSTGSKLDRRDTGSIASRRSTRSQRSSNLKPTQSTTSSRKKCTCVRDSSSHRSSVALSSVSALSSDSASNRQLQQIRCAEVGPDIYRNVLGPTPDETVLAGLQTVIDLCTIAYPRLGSGNLLSPQKSPRGSNGSSNQSRRRSTFASPERSLRSFSGSTSGSLVSPRESDEDLKEYNADINQNLVPAERETTAYDDGDSNTFGYYEEHSTISAEQQGASQEIIRDIQSYLNSQDALDDLSLNKSKSVWIYITWLAYVILFF